MYFEFLANDNDSFLAIDKGRKDWQLAAMIAKRQVTRISNSDTYVAEMTKNPSEERQEYKKKKLEEKRRKLKKDIEKEDALTAMRKWFLLKYFLESPDDDGRGKARIQQALFHDDLREAGLTTEHNISCLPSGSAILTLKFRLLSPLLTKDDDPFYLFDNPVRRDHIFGVPYLAAASVKGLSVDAYQRGFIEPQDWSALGENDAVRTRQFRIRDSHARRLFGLADDGVQDESSQAGRLHFSPVWFPSVQYLVMNPMDSAQAIGSTPIQFEAIAPLMADGKNRVEVELHVFYFNPVGAPESDTATVRGDLARWLAAVAAWWSVLGLGAKRLAGYGAIEPVSAICQARNWQDWPEKQELEGTESWMKLAERIAEGV